MNIKSPETNTLAPFDQFENAIDNLTASYIQSGVYDANTARLEARRVAEKARNRGDQQLATFLLIHTELN